MLDHNHPMTHVLNGMALFVANVALVALPKFMAALMLFMGCALYAIQLWERPTVRAWRRKIGMKVAPRNPED